MSYVFEQFLDLYPNFVEENDIKKPEFLKNSGNISTRYLTNQRIKDFIEKNEDNEYLFKVFLNAFKEPMSKPRGLISKEDVDRFNYVHRFLKQFSEQEKPDFNDVSKFYYKNQDI
jgi:NDP-sugar pyrophosphorylase family protein